MPQVAPAVEQLHLQPLVLLPQQLLLLLLEPAQLLAVQLLVLLEPSSVGQLQDLDLDPGRGEVRIYGGSMEDLLPQSSELQSQKLNLLVVVERAPIQYQDSRVAHQLPQKTPEPLVQS